MRIVKQIFLWGAVGLFFVGLYFWLAVGRMDQAAFFIALAACGQGTFLMASKADR